VPIKQIDQEKNIMRKTTLLVLVALVAFASATFSQTSNTDRASVEAAIRGYHEALKSGDTAQLVKLLAVDVVILESGSRESRDEYLSHHLQRDIEFAKAVPEKRGELSMRVVGDVAWVSSIATRSGTFRGRSINLATAELAVLSKNGSEWTIQSIHWSSRPLKAVN
jgi:ketosteroid isomerase-like protein